MTYVGTAVDTGGADALRGLRLGGTGSFGARRATTGRVAPPGSPGTGRGEEANPAARCTNGDGDGDTGAPAPACGTSMGAPSPSPVRPPRPCRVGRTVAPASGGSATTGTTAAGRSAGGDAGPAGSGAPRPDFRAWARCTMGTLGADTEPSVSLGGTDTGAAMGTATGAAMGVDAGVRAGTGAGGRAVTGGVAGRAGTGSTGTRSETGERSGARSLRAGGGAGTGDARAGGAVADASRAEGGAGSEAVPGNSGVGGTAVVLRMTGGMAGTGGRPGEAVGVEGGADVPA
ncbi:hypothetical protein SGFS_068080 [Streptomyces graminofaciens]|uniref:Uncharacterized protein n=1 Tax=Streptomyces graminofaciens TaxID=68212 RepID=A0ABN5VQ64_9ACTN|nr:hypothetical protein SGFS_068080 [Streptomyces graminofaciens]